jgi:hypothetical protein
MCLDRADVRRQHELSQKGDDQRHGFPALHLQVGDQHDGEKRLRRGQPQLLLLAWHQGHPHQRAGAEAEDERQRGDE